MKLSLKAVRVNAGYSQDDMAKKLNVSTSTISRWEKGVTPIPKKHLANLCNIYNIKPEIIKKENKE